MYMTWKQMIKSVLIISLALAFIQVSKEYQYGFILHFLGLMPITYYVVGYYKYKNKFNQKEN